MIQKENHSIQYNESTSSMTSAVRDLEYCLGNTVELKENYEKFLEQQVSKISLQEARLSIRKARDIRRLSFLAFILNPSVLSALGLA